MIDSIFTFTSEGYPQPTRAYMITLLTWPTKSKELCEGNFENVFKNSNG